MSTLRSIPLGVTDTAGGGGGGGEGGGGGLASSSSGNAMFTINVPFSVIEEHGK